MTWLIIVSLILVGLIFLLLEILVVPGTTVVGFVGVGMMGYGVFAAYNGFGNAAGTYTLLATLLSLIVAIALALKSNTWKKVMLGAEVDSKVNIVEAEKLQAGDEGVTISRLNPMGKALIKEEYYEVTSKDNLVDPGTPIVVLKVEGNKIIVKPKSE